MAKPCERCGEPLVGRIATARFCVPCLPARFVDNGGYAAHRKVSDAVKRGKLPSAKTRACADCGKPAFDYDHRDYGKPLEVEPVCRSCNRLRGPARPVLTFELPG